MGTTVSSGELKLPTTPCEVWRKCYTTEAQLDRRNWDKKVVSYSILK